MENLLHSRTTPRYLRLVISISLIAIAAAQSSAFQCRAQMSKIQHIVIIVQEARSFDTVLGAFPGVNGATSGNYLGETIPLRETPLSSQTLPDNFAGTNKIITGGMDDFYYDGGDLDKSAYVQFPQSEAPDYWSYAQNFAVVDNFFASTYGPSFPNHLYLVAATSDNVIGNPNSTVSWGCDAPSGTTVLLSNGQSVFPCFNINTLPAELTAAVVSWQYYSAPEGQPGYIWSTLDAVSNIRNSTLWSNNVLPVTNFIANVSNGNLASVVWVTPPSADSDSPPANVCVGQNWTVQAINAIMNSGEYWPNTAIFLTWSNYGGYYDHVPPPVVDSFGLGIRVPLLIISPYAKQGYADHTQTEFSSLLKSVEERFGVASLSGRDTVANDIWGAFDFSQQPAPPVLLSTQKCFN